MKDKEIIEEMAKDLEAIETEEGHKMLNETFAYVKEHHKYNRKEDFNKAHDKTIYQRTAEGLYNIGYIKQEQGQWNEKEITGIYAEEDLTDIIFECSICGSQNFGMSYYCPNCGAKMINETLKEFIGEKS